MGAAALHPAALKRTACRVAMSDVALQRAAAGLDERRGAARRASRLEHRLDDAAERPDRDPLVEELAENAAALSWVAYALAESPQVLPRPPASEPREAPKAPAPPDAKAAASAVK